MAMRRIFPAIAILGVVSAGSIARAEDDPKPSIDCSEIGPTHVYETTLTETRQRTESCLLDGVLDGPHLVTTLEGQVVTRGQYLQGELSGLWRRWFPSGKPRDEGPWMASRPEGPWKFWDEQGTLRREGRFRDGREHGIWNIWSKEGKLEAQGEHENGAKVCDWKVWDSEGMPELVREKERQARPCPPVSAGERSSPSAVPGASSAASRLSVILGLGQTSHEETTKAPYSMFAVTPKIAYTQPIGGTGFHLGVNGFITGFAMTSTASEISVRHLGANLRLGYQVPLLPPQWKLTLFGGISYASMWVTRNAFGYKNVLFPQLYPSLQRALSPRQALTLHFKYAALGSGFLSFSDPSRELAAGLTWSYLLKNQKPLSLLLDWSDTRLVSALGHSTASSSIVMGIGYSPF